LKPAVELQPVRFFQVSGFIHLNTKASVLKSSVFLTSHPGLFRQPYRMLAGFFFIKLFIKKAHKYYHSHIILIHRKLPSALFLLGFITKVPNWG